jgi:DHA2 family multidrug resistance protein-like MFS transporter
VFLINVPIMVLALIGGWLLLPESRGNAGQPIDLVSSALSILAIVPLVYAVKRWVGTGFGGIVVVVAALAMLAAWLFLRRQTRLTVPLLDLSLFRVPAFAGAVGANLLSIFAFLGLLFFFSQYLQLVRGFGPLQAGLAELPATIAAMAVIALIGVLTRRLGVGRSIGLGLTVAAIGLVGISVTTPLASYWGLGVALALLGFGIGISMTMSVDAVVSAVPKERAGAASAISETAYELGGALGIAVLGSLHLAMYRSALVLPAEVDAAQAGLVRESLSSTLVVIDDAAIVVPAQDAFAAAMQTTSLVAAAVLLLAAWIAWRVIPSTPTVPEVTHDAA